MDFSVWDLYCSHVTIMMCKVDPRVEGGAVILIKESYIRSIEMCRFGKSSTDKTKKNF